MTTSSRQRSEIDRLIELASAESPASAVTEEIAAPPAGSFNHSLSLEDKKDPRPSMWRLLLQLRVLLPYLSRLLPLLERTVLGTNITGSTASVDTTHFDRGLEEIEGGHRDLSQQLKTQTSEIKYLQEQVSWLSKSLEKGALKQEETAAAIASVKKLATIWASIVVALLVALIGLVIFLLVSRPA